MRRLFPIAVLILLFALVGMLVWVANHLDAGRQAPAAPRVQSQLAPPPPAGPTACESILAGYADPATPPLEDLRKIHRIAISYFSLVKDARRFPIGGNADFAAALRGENPNREVFVRAGHPAFSAEGLLLDRWGSPVIVHPEAWRQLELRSAGPDRVPYNDDDLILTPAGIPSQPR